MTEPLLPKARTYERSIEHLQTLYSTAVGVSLAVVMAQVIAVNGRETRISVAAIPTVVAFLVTLIPFYHGAQRHLDDTYRPDRANHAAPGQAPEAPVPPPIWVLMGDFLTLFIESCLFFALAAFVRQPLDFAGSLITLLALDAAWGATAYFLGRRRRRRGGEFGWAVLNLLTIVVLAGLFVVGRSSPDPNLWLRWAVLAVCLGRSAADYFVARETYFGRMSRAH